MNLHGAIDEIHRLWTGVADEDRGIVEGVARRDGITLYCQHLFDFSIWMLAFSVRYVSEVEVRFSQVSAHYEVSVLESFAC